MSASFALPNCWQPSPPPSQGARVGGGVLSPTHLPQKRGDSLILPHGHALMAQVPAVPWGESLFKLWNPLAAGAMAADSCQTPG